MLRAKRAIMACSSRKAGASRSATRAKRKKSTSFCTRLRARFPSASSLAASRFFSRLTSGRKMYLPMTMKSSEHSAQAAIAISMYRA